MNTLTEILQVHPEFTSKSPLERSITAALATAFQDSKKAFALGPDELVFELNRGTEQQWREFLAMTPVKNYIRQRLAEEADIASRKALSTLTREALSGDVQAINRLNDLAGLLNKGSSNKIVVLHRIPRPEVSNGAE
jgi:hypothetical protein